MPGREKGWRKKQLGLLKSTEMGGLHDCGGEGRIKRQRKSLSTDGWAEYAVGGEYGRQRKDRSQEKRRMKKERHLLDFYVASLAGGKGIGYIFQKNEK